MTTTRGTGGRVTTRTTTTARPPVRPYGVTNVPVWVDGPLAVFAVSRL